MTASASRTQVVKFIRKGETGEKGERGAVMRIQEWDGCAVGFAFQSGASGEGWTDVVVYGGSYYYCRTSHAKTASNWPGSSASESGKLWQLGDRVGLVATDLLIAGNEVVDNLCANYIEMTDADGNAVFTAKDGNVTCNKGTFRNVEVTGKVTANSGAVGGFAIGGVGLTNTTDNATDAYIQINGRQTDGSTAKTTKVAQIGVWGSTYGESNHVAKFYNQSTATETDPWTKNYAVIVAASGRHDNAAIHIEGGTVEGLAMSNRIIGTSSTSATVTRFENNIICMNSAACTLTLPVMQLCDDGHVIRIKRLGSGQVNIRMSNCYTYHVDTTDGSLLAPVMIYNRGAVLRGTDTLAIESKGESMELVWCRDIGTDTEGAVCYGAWVQYKLPRDW